MIKSKDDLKYYLQQDRIMNKVSESKFKQFLDNIIENPSRYKFLKTLRYAEYYTNVKTPFRRFLWFYYKIKLKRLSKRLGYTIPVNTCGAGLSIPHYGTIIINPAARIGENCRLHACVNIGTSGGSKLAPTIGDNVYIGPSVVIFGDICLANNITIGANSTVNKSFTTENVVIAGSPAKIVKEDASTWLNFNNMNH